MDDGYSHCSGAIWIWFCACCVHLCYGVCYTHRSFVDDCYCMFLVCLYSSQLLCLKCEYWSTGMAMEKFQHWETVRAGMWGTVLQVPYDWQSVLVYVWQCLLVREVRLGCDWSKIFLTPWCEKQCPWISDFPLWWWWAAAFWQTVSLNVDFIFQG